MPSGDILELYFPCGSSGELHPVERAVPADGDELVVEAVALYLAGPTEHERDAGFSSMLSPGDIDIIDISDGRLVLNFLTEVNNVSTSAGSRAVLDGLQQTLIGLDNIEQIELTLRNDCAAFFEWIQVGPTCHVLRADGLTPAPAGEAPVSAVQVPTCEHSSGAYRVTLPDGWWTNPQFEDTELGEVAACRFFAPSEFDVTTGNRETPVPDGIAVWMQFLDGGCVGYINPILSSRDTTVAGYPAVISELAFGKEETNPPHTYEYVVTLAHDDSCTSEGRYVHAFSTRDFAGDYEENKAVLDAMMETIEIRSP